MITLIHGDHVEASRTELARLRSGAKDREIRRLDGKTIDETAVTQALESSSLFGNTPLVIIERLFSGKQKKSKELAAIVALLKKSADSCDCIVWEDKALEASTVAGLGKPTVKLFKIPPKIFQLLDGLAPRHASSLLAHYEFIKNTEAPELVFAMIAKRVRQLMAIGGGAHPAGLADWQASRLTKQASFFTMEQLISMHETLLQAEYSLKTGASPYQLSELLEQFFIAM